MIPLPDFPVRTPRSNLKAMLPRATISTHLKAIPSPCMHRILISSTPQPSDPVPFSSCSSPRLGPRVHTSHVERASCLSAWGIYPNACSLVLAVGPQGRWATRFPWWAITAFSRSVLDSTAFGVGQVVDVAEVGEMLPFLGNFFLT